MIAKHYCVDQWKLFLCIGRRQFFLYVLNALNCWWRCSNVNEDAYYKGSTRMGISMGNHFLIKMVQGHRLWNLLKRFNDNIYEKGILWKERNHIRYEYTRLGFTKSVHEYMWLMLTSPIRSLSGSVDSEESSLGMSPWLPKGPEYIICTMIRDMLGWLQGVTQSTDDSMHILKCCLAN